jgi:protein tyrosine phosphatase (PTP) superfamily phosphohydrolase (DUF442 family)
VDPIPVADPAITDDRRRRRLRRWVVLGVFLAGCLAFASYFRGPLFRGNLDEVDPGLVYRSAQPVGDVVRLIHEHKIGSILNLRGGKESDPWYVAEVAAAESERVDFYDFPLSAVRRPTRRELIGLLGVLDRCKYPLLIHCKSGSDRTGLAAGMYLMYRRGVPPDRAEAAFSLAHGHVPLLGPERLHEPFDEYAAWLDAEDLEHTPDRLLDWVRHHYRADDPLVAVTPVLPGPRIRRQAALPSQTPR